MRRIKKRRQSGFMSAADAGDALAGDDEGALGEPLDGAPTADARRDGAAEPPAGAAEPPLSAAATMLAEVVATMAGEYHVYPPHASDGAHPRPRAADPSDPAVRALQAALRASEARCDALEAELARERAERLALTERCNVLRARLAGTAAGPDGDDADAGDAPVGPRAPTRERASSASALIAQRLASVGSGGAVGGMLSVAVPIAPPRAHAAAERVVGVAGAAGAAVAARPAADQRVQTVPALLELAGAVALESTAAQLAARDARAIGAGASLAPTVASLALTVASLAPTVAAAPGAPAVATPTGVVASATLLAHLRAVLMPVLEQLARVDVVAAQLRAVDEEAHEQRLRAHLADAARAAPAAAEPAACDTSTSATHATLGASSGDAAACSGRGGDAPGGDAPGCAADAPAQAPSARALGTCVTLQSVPASPPAVEPRVAAASAADYSVTAVTAVTAVPSARADGACARRGGADGAWGKRPASTLAEARVPCASPPRPSSPPSPTGVERASRRRQRRAGARVSFATHDLSAVQPPNVFVLGSERPHNQLIELLAELRERHKPLLALMRQDSACSACVRTVAHALAQLAEDDGRGVTLPMRSAARFYAAEFYELAGAGAANGTDGGDVDACGAPAAACAPGAPVLQWRLQQLLLSSMRFHLSMILNEDSPALEAMRSSVLARLDAARVPTPQYNVENFAALVTNALRQWRAHGRAAKSELVLQLVREADGAAGGTPADGVPAADERDARPGRGGGGGGGAGNPTGARDGARAPSAAEVSPAEREALCAFVTALTILDVVFLGDANANRQRAPQPGTSGGHAESAPKDQARQSVNAAGAAAPAAQQPPDGAHAAPTFAALCALPENVPFMAMVATHAEQVRAIGCEDELHLSVLAELPAFCEQLRACRRPAQCVIAWLQGGAAGTRKRRKPAR